MFIIPDADRLPLALVDRRGPEFGADGRPLRLAAVKFAREEANGAEANNVTISEKLFNYLFG